MKRFITFFAILMAAVLSFAQIPQTMSYQAVVRDGDNALVISKPVSIELSILRGSDEGDVVYAEKHDATTNANGLISLELGNGEQISETAFSQIDWSAGPYFVKTVAEIDGKTVTGVTPMLTVPYAKFAEKAGNIPDLTDYAKKSDIPEGANLDGYVKTEELNDYAKSADVDNTYVKKAEMPATLEDYAKKSDIPESANLENYVKTEDLADYALKSEIPTETNLDGYVKTEELNDYAKTADVEQTYAKKGELPTEVDLSDYAKKSDLDGFATTAKMNDTLNVYAKSTDVSGNYVTKEEFENYVLSGGQADAIDLSVYAKSADVNAALAELEGKIPAEQDLTNYATKEELNALNIPSVEGLASETYVNEQVAAVQIPSVPTKVSDLENDANYITLNDVPATDLTDYAKSAEVSATYVTKDEFETYVLSGGQADAVDLSVYAKSSDVTAALAELEGRIPAAQDLTGYATKEELNALNIPSVEGLASETYVNEKVAAIQIPTVPTKVSDFANDANYITLNDVPATDLTGYATKEELGALSIPSVEGLASETYVNEKVAAIQIPTVPTKVSDFENDANYITLNDVPATDLTAYAKTADVESVYAQKSALNSYATTAKMNDTLDAYVLKSEMGPTNLDGYYSKAEVDALLAEMNERFAALSDWVEASKNPKLSKPTLSKMVDTDVTLNAKITSAGFGDIIERGFVCSRTPNPTVTDNEQKYVSSGTSVDENYIGGFSYLASGYTYYIRAYATSSTGTGYSEPYILTTTLMAPVINSGGYRNVTAESFEMHSSVKFEAQITQWGFCYSSTTEYPTTSGDKVTVDVAGKDFEATITGLVPGKTYYVRPFATNSMGTTYSSTYTVTTPAVPPTVERLSTTEVAGKSFKVTAEIAFNGGATVTAKGFCYSMSENPTIEDSKVTGEQAEGDNFIAEVTELSPVTTYYVRAYATNSAGTSYSDQITVTTTAALATIADVTSSEITAVSFNVSSEITDNGGTEVTEKGFCYSTTENPTIDDTKIAVDGDDFETTIEELANGTIYYVRAYAVNSVGTAYSEQISVLTLAPATLADVTSSDITGVSFKVSSEITANGGAEVIEKGFCYSTTENPTVNDTKIAVDDEFETKIDELSYATTYYVRAYAVNAVGTAYSEQKIVITDKAPYINAAFSVSSTKKIYFSSGNLQYNAAQGTHECADGTTQPGTWRFAEQQYDTCGISNANVSSTYNGWIDIFGFGTSGWDSGLTGKTAYQPYSTVNQTDKYIYKNLTGDYANADWGVYNAISNGGNEPGMWRTLTKAEWTYLTDTRTNASYKQGLATVNNVQGIVLLPDKWNLPSGLSFVYGGSPTYMASEHDFSKNIYSASDWEKMEANGAVFLPVTCNRSGQLLSSGWYATSTAQGDYYAPFIFQKRSTRWIEISNTYHYSPSSVRLVKDVE